MRSDSPHNHIVRHTRIDSLRISCSPAPISFHSKILTPGLLKDSISEVLLTPSARMSASRKPSFLSLPAEIPREIVLHHILLLASEFEAPNRILAAPFDRPSSSSATTRPRWASYPLFSEGSPRLPPYQ